MSITMPDGRTYTYLSDGLMVNGRRVTEARVNGTLVYPRDEWPYWVRGTTTIDFHNESESWKWDYGKGETVVFLLDVCDYHVEVSFSVSSRLPIRVWAEDRWVTNSDVPGGKVAYPMEMTCVTPKLDTGDISLGRILRSSIDLRWSARGRIRDRPFSVPERHMSGEGADLISLVPPMEWGFPHGGFAYADGEALSFKLPGYISFYDSDTVLMSFGFSGNAIYLFRGKDTPDGKRVYTRRRWAQTFSIKHSPSPWATAEEYKAAWLAARDAL